MEKIIEALSQKYNLPKFVISQIIESQFKFVREKVESGDLHNIRLIDLGTFCVSEHRKAAYREHMQREYVKPEVKKPRPQLRQFQNTTLEKKLQELEKNREDIKTRF